MYYRAMGNVTAASNFMQITLKHTGRVTSYMNRHNTLLTSLCKQICHLL
jgi:hypothetical protein